MVGQPVKLRPWQKRIIRKIYDTPTRRAIISFGRKNGKTALSAMLCLLHLCGPEAVPNSQLYSAAMSQKQAAVLYELAAKMVRMSSDLIAYVLPRDYAKQLLCHELGTIYSALSAEHATAFGMSPVFVVHDELGQVRGPRSALYTALETGMGAHESPLSIVISTQAATDADLMSELIDRALAGGNPREKVFLYAAPEDCDPFSLSAIKAANPAYGDFQSADEIAEQVYVAQTTPSQEAQYRNLVLNQRIEVNAPYVSVGVWKANGGPPRENWSGLKVYGGLDLSATTDLTALVLVAPDKDGVVHVRPTFWLPENGLRDKAQRDKQIYDVWAREGHLQTCPGNTVDYAFVAEYLRGVFEDYDVQTIAFDRWNMKHFVPWLERAGFGVTDGKVDGFEEFGQGFASMSPALRDLDGILLNDRMRHGMHPVLSMCATSAIVKEDPAGNRKLVKASPERRIDGMISLAMAVSVMARDMEDAKPKVSIYSRPELWRSATNA